MDIFIGQIILAAFNRLPSGFFPCDGRILSYRSDRYLQALYSLIGNKWGGDQSQMTFALPDLRDKAPDPSLQYAIAYEGIYPVPRD